MKKIYYINILCALATLTACTAEETFRFTGRETNKVNFDVVNLTVGMPDDAQSLMLESYGNYWTQPMDSSACFSFYINFLENDGVEEVRIDKEYTNMVYAGGNNELRFTFHPSCPEEKSATFTMPDGKVYEVDASNNSFTWNVNRGVIPEGSDRYALPVVAESSYEKDGSIYNNRGFILINVERMNFCYFNNHDDRWYHNNWLEGEHMFKSSRLMFNAANISVAEVDSAASVKNEWGYNFYNRDTYEEFSLDIHGLPGTSDSTYSENRRIDLYYSNVIWAGGNNDIKIKYTPSNPEEAENTIFTMPDGQTFTPSAEQTEFVWTLDSATYANVTNTYSGCLIIEGFAKYPYQGIDREASGYILIEVGRDISLNRSNGLWYLTNWANTRSRSRAGYMTHKK